MNGNRNHCRGFSLVEMSVAASILVMAVAVAMGGFLYVMRGSNMSNYQNELDTQIQVAMEKIKYHARLSSLDLMYYHPSGPGPYTAISFPMARDDDGDGAIEMDAADNIIWDQTLVYHVWSGDPTQLRLTTFDPRDNTLSEKERQEQLDSVVVRGNGSSTHNGAKASTVVVFENLFNWQLTPRGSRYDGYAPEVSREENVVLGSCVLTNGPHTFTFTLLDKNRNSTGYKVGIDSIFASPSYGRREAEAQLPATAVSGTAPYAQEMAGGSWSGNYHLMFPATKAGETFTITMPSDRWEETNFGGTGFSADETVIVYDQSVNPKDFLVRLVGYGYSWSAYLQTGATNEFGSPLSWGYMDPGEAINGCAVRVVLRGKEMESGNWIDYSGGQSWIWFQAGGATTNEQLTVEEAYIAECADPDNLIPDMVPGTLRRLVKWPSKETSISLAGTQGVWAYHNLADFSIDRSKSYVVSFRVKKQLHFGHAMFWPEVNDPSRRGSYLLPNAVAGDASAAVWSTRTNLVVSPNLYAIRYLYTSYPTNGTYSSPVFDTQVESPVYRTMGWNAMVPSDSRLSLKVRTGGDAEMSDAPAWTNLTAITVPGSINPGNGRYAQFQAIFRPSTYGFDTPRLQNVNIDWEGETRLVDVGGTMTRGPDYGIFELKVDGKELKTGLYVNLEIFKDVFGYRNPQRITSALSVEIVPRNTGR